MKIENNTNHSRTLVVTNIPKKHPNDLDTLTITISYVDDNTGSRLYKAIALDHHVIPAIISAINKSVVEDEDMEANSDWTNINS